MGMRISKEPAIRRQEIIDTARGLFEARGTARVAMADIAEQAGITKGLVYYYFSSREALLAEVVDQLAEGVDRTLMERVAKAGIGFTGKLVAILQVFFTVIQSHPRLLDTAQSEPMVRSLAYERLFQVAHKHGAAVLAEGARQGLVRLAYPEAMLRILVRGLGDLYIEGCTDPKMHATIVEQTLGLPHGCLSLEALPQAGP